MKLIYLLAVVAVIGGVLFFSGQTQSQPVILNADDFFVKLIKNEADITTGTAIFETCNPLNRPITAVLNTNIIYRKGKRITGIEPFVLKNVTKQIQNNTFSEVIQTCDDIDNTTQTPIQTDCSYNRTIINYDLMEVEEYVKSPPAINYKANECKTVMLKGSWKASTTPISNDWIPSFFIEGNYYNQTRWAWWNTSWAYKQTINITNNNLTANLSDGYTVNISINTSDSSKFMVNGSDVRIVYQDTLELSRENVTPFSNAAINTVLVFRTLNNISGGAIDQNYSVYYGNPNSLNAPNTPMNIYHVAENCDDGDLTNNPVWTNTLGNWQCSDKGWLNITGSVGSSHYTHTSSNITHAVWSFVLRQVNSGNPDHQFNFYPINNTDAGEIHRLSILAVSNTLTYIIRTDSKNTTNNDIIDGAFHNISIYRDQNNTVQLYVDNKLNLTIQNSSVFNSTSISLYQASATGITEWFLDNLTVRKFMRPEPTTALEPSVKGVNMTITNPTNTTFTSNLIDYNITIETGSFPDTVYYSINGTTNQSLTNDSISNWFNLSSSHGILQEGDNNMTFWANDSNGHENWSVIYFTIDSKAPNYSNVGDENGGSVLYISSGQTHDFFINVTDVTSGVDTVIIEFNGGNTTVTSSTDKFTNTKTGLNPATYTYKWFMNDTAGNWNITPQQSYTVTSVQGGGTSGGGGGGTSYSTVGGSVVIGDGFCDIAAGETKDISPDDCKDISNETQTVTAQTIVPRTIQESTTAQLVFAGLVVLIVAIGISRSQAKERKKRRVKR